MIRNSFLSKFISACFLIFLFGININIAFCVEYTSTTNEEGGTFIVSGIEYKITRAVVGDDLGSVCAVKFNSESIVLTRRLNIDSAGAEFKYLVTEIDFSNNNSAEKVFVCLENFSKNDVESLELGNIANIKAIYVKESNLVSNLNERFLNADVYMFMEAVDTSVDINLTCALEENNTIKLTWDKLDNADNYVITRTDRFSGEVIETITKNCEYIDSGVEAGKTYDYAVTAFLGSGEKNDTFTVQVGSSETKELSIPNQESSDVNTNLGSSNAIISKPNHVTNNNNSLDSTNNESNNLQDNNNLESNETDKNYSSDNKNTNKLNVYKTGDARNHMVLFFCVMYFIGFFAFLCVIEYKRN